MKTLRQIVRASSMLLGLFVVIGCTDNSASDTAEISSLLTELKQMSAAKGDHLFLMNELTERSEENMAAALPLLDDFIQDPSATEPQREAVVMMLRNWGGAAAVTAPALQTLSGDTTLSPGLRRGALSALGQMVQEAGLHDLGFVVPFLHDPDPDLQDAGLAVLEQHGLPAANMLCELAGDTTTGPRPSIDSVLSRLGRIAQPVCIEPLSAFLGHEDPKVIRSAAYALGQIGPEAAPAMPALLHATRTDCGTESADECGAARQLAIRALGQIGREADRVVPVLHSILLDATFFEQLTAAKSLGAFGPAASSALPDLEAFLASLDDIESEPVMAMEKASIAESIEKVKGGT